MLLGGFIFQNDFAVLLQPSVADNVSFTVRPLQVCPAIRQQRFSGRPQNPVGQRAEHTSSCASGQSAGVSFQETAGVDDKTLGSKCPSASDRSVLL